MPLMKKPVIVLNFEQATELEQRLLRRIILGDQSHPFFEVITPRRAMQRVIPHAPKLVAAGNRIDVRQDERAARIHDLL